MIFSHESVYQEFKSDEVSHGTGKWYLKVLNGSVTGEC